MKLKIHSELARQPARERGVASEEFCYKACTNINTALLSYANYYVL